MITIVSVDIMYLFFFVYTYSEKHYEWCWCRSSRSCLTSAWEKDISIVTARLLRLYFPECSFAFGFLRLRCLSTHLSMIKTESVLGSRLSAEVRMMSEEAILNVAAIPLSVCKMCFKTSVDLSNATFYCKVENLFFLFSFFSSSSYFHRILVSHVIAHVNNPDPFAPVNPKSSTQNINRGPAFVPLHWRFRLDRTVRWTCLETSAFDHFSCMFNHFRASFNRSLPIVEGQKCSLVFNPSAISAQLLNKIFNQTIAQQTFFLPKLF